MMRYSWIGLCVAGLLVLGGCSGMSNKQLRQELSAMTPGERDRVGMKTVRTMQQEKRPETEYYRYKQIHYRAASDTFVMQAELKKVQTVSSVSRSQRAEARRQFAEMSRKSFCGNRKLRDLMQYGGYRFELQVDAANGSRLFAPVIIRAADCTG